MIFIKIFLIIYRELIEIYDKRKRLLAYLRKKDPHMYQWVVRDYKINENFEKIDVGSFQPRIVLKKSGAIKKRYRFVNPL